MTSADEPCQVCSVSAEEGDAYERDDQAEAWLRERHDRDWWIGNATEADWQDAYVAVDAAAAVVGGQ